MTSPLVQALTGWCPRSGGREKGELAMQMDPGTISRSLESSNVETHVGLNVCPEDVHTVGPFSIWNTADRSGSVLAASSVYEGLS